MYQVSVTNWQTTFYKQFSDIDEAITFAYSYSSQSGYHVTCQRIKAL